MKELSLDCNKKLPEATILEMLEAHKRKVEKITQQYMELRVLLGNMKIFHTIQSETYNGSCVLVSLDWEAFTGGKIEKFYDTFNYKHLEYDRFRKGCLITLSGR